MDKEFYITGLPIETEIGMCRFLKVNEFPKYFHDLNVLSLTKENLINKYRQINNNNIFDEFISELQKSTLFEITVGIPELQVSYYKILHAVFSNEESLKNINENNFYSIRELILTMNCIKEEKINPNPEIQKAIERSRRVKSRESDSTTFADIVSSIVGFNGLTYNDINEFTIYQLYMTYYRIAYIKNYDTSTLFATVSSEKVKIDSWSKHINLFEEEKHSISHDDFKKTTGKVITE